MVHFFVTFFLLGCCASNANAETVCINDSIPQLSEIFIIGKRKAIVQKNDTMVFRPEAFKNGTEKTLEALLAKIPGIKVNPLNGSLSFMGKTIQAVKLDGADLTGSDYVNLTRNIAADMIDEIEAIDNDPDNPLLKEIQTSGKQVLNLKLKKSATQLRGDATVGAGIFSNRNQVSEVKANLLHLSKKIKSFVTSGFNNSGINYSAFNYFDDQENEPISQTPNKLLALIPSFMQQMPMAAQRFFINQNYSVNGNFLMQPTNQYSSVRLNIYAMRDRLYSQHNQFNKFRPDIIIPVTSDDLSVYGHPLTYKVNLEWKQYITPKLWMKYNVLNEHKTQTEKATQLINQKIGLDMNSSQYHFLHQHQLDITYSIDKQTAIRTVLKAGIHRLNEQLSLERQPQHDSLYECQKQDVLQSRKMIEYSTVLSARNKNYDYEFEVGLSEHTSTFNTSSYGIDSNAVNQTRQQYIQAYQKAHVAFRWGKWMFNSKLKISTNNFLIEGIKEGKIINHFPGIEPELSVSKKLSNQLKWVNVLSFHNRPISDRPFFEQPVLISARQVYVNKMRPDLQHIFKAQSVFVAQNHFRQQHAQLNMGYVRSAPVLVPVMAIDERYMKTSFTIVKSPAVYYFIQSNAEKFIPKLRTTIAFNINYSLSNYFNLINNDNQRNNTMRLFETGSTIKAVLYKKVNLVYDFKWIHTSVYTTPSDRQNNQQGIQSLQIIWQNSQKGFIRIMAERIRPQSSSSYAVLFLDAEIQFKPEGHKYSFALVGKNLLNHSFFRQLQITDYGSTEMQTRLLPGYVMVLWTYRF